MCKNYHLHISGSIPQAILLHSMVSLNTDFWKYKEDLRAAYKNSFFPKHEELYCNNVTFVTTNIWITFWEYPKKHNRFWTHFN